MSIQSIHPLTAGGYALDMNHVGELRDSSSIATDAAALRFRIEADGYIYLPQILDRHLVFEARGEMTRRLAREGHLQEGTNPINAIARPGSTLSFKADLAKGNAPLMRLLYGGRMIEWFERFLSSPVRHFDYTWIRCVAPGKGTPSHCDSVYMNRGTSRLFTAWTPLGDIDFAQGGLMVLEGSNRNQRLRETYCTKDVDTYCENRPKRNDRHRIGHLSHDPNKIQRAIGGDWLTGEYRAGDLLVFTIFTVHASLDNHSDRIRLSSDTRYQPAGEAVDERWVGANPGAHGNSSLRGRIC